MGIETHKKMKGKVNKKIKNDSYLKKRNINKLVINKI